MGIKLFHKILLSAIIILTVSCQPPDQQEVAPAPTTYTPDWESLTQYPEAQWLHDAKFGIYTHWGVYSVPAYGNEWYPRWMYARDAEDNHFYRHHLETYGDPAEFGYKDFIPSFFAENFDAREWAELFLLAGARFAGAVAEHHDGFAMWNSNLTEWDALDKGPHLDILLELANAIRLRGMKFVTSFHHAQRWWHYEESYSLDNPDTKDTAFAGINKLYPPAHEPGTNPPAEYYIFWENKVREVIDKYQPDYLWFDFGWHRPEFDPYKRELLSYYYNKSLEWGKEVVVSYKHDHLPKGAGILDLERGKIDTLTKFKWITDTSIDHKSWCYIDDPEYKSVNTLIDNLVDRVSKNGTLLLNVAPKADGSIPQKQRELLLEMGQWLRANGEAIYNTRPWIRYGEGPTRHESGQFSEHGIDNYTAEDIRFTRRGDDLYAILLDWPEDGKVLIRSLGKGQPVNFRGIRDVSMVGNKGWLEWNRKREGLEVYLPEVQPTFHAHVLKIYVRQWKD